MDKNSLIGLLFSGGTALAGLILVFLGAALSGYESYDRTAKTAVRSQYRWRGGIALAGFILAMLSALVAFAANWLPYSCLLPISAVCFTASFVVVLIVAIKAVGDIS